MGLIELAARAHIRLDTWSWRARYFWFDTEGGAHANAGMRVCLWMLVIVSLVRNMLAARDYALHPERQQEAVIWWVVYLVVALIAAAVAYAMMPKIEQQKPQGANPPSTEDGQAVVDILGTGWIEDFFVLAWKPNGVTKIKSKGKK
jgi:hypothetical protein